MSDKARREALSDLVNVADEIGGMCVHGVADQPGKFTVGALTLINWRDRIAKALRTLDGY